MGSSELLGVPPELLDQLLGPLPQAVPPSMGQQLLESLSGLQNAIPTPGKGFGPNFGAGLARAVGAAGSRAEAQRAEYEKRIRERQALRDQLAIKATLDKQAREAKAAGENRTLTQWDIQNAPAGSIIARAQEGATIPVDVYKRIMTTETPEQRAAIVTAEGLAKARLPQTPAEQRAEAAARRAADAAQRQADAAERQNRLAQVQTVGQLADDYRLDKSITGYQQVRSNFRTAKTGAARNNGPGDIAVIFSFMRALEPENPNAVREGEFDNAQKATGLLQTVRNLPSRYFKGNRLTTEGRQYFLDTMQSILESRREDYDAANAQYRQRAQAGGINPDLIIREYPMQRTKIVNGELVDIP